MPVLQERPRHQHEGQRRQREGQPLQAAPAEAFVRGGLGGPAQRPRRQPGQAEAEPQHRRLPEHGRLLQIGPQAGEQAAEFGMLHLSL